MHAMEHLLVFCYVLMPASSFTCQPNKSELKRPNRLRKIIFCDILETPVLNIIE